MSVEKLREQVAQLENTSLIQKADPPVEDTMDLPVQFPIGREDMSNLESILSQEICQKRVVSFHYDVKVPKAPIAR